VKKGAWSYDAYQEKILPKYYEAGSEEIRSLNYE